MFYTYLWLREDGTPYYAGKGKGNRAYKNHRIGKAPLGRIVIYPAESEADAFETEVALIWYYGRKCLGTGCLINLSNGGDGPAGRPCSESAKFLISASLKAQGIKPPKFLGHTEEAKEKIRNSMAKSMEEKYGPNRRVRRTQNGHRGIGTIA